MTPIMISKPGQKGGDVKFARVKNDIGLYLKQGSDTLLTLFVDYYGIKKELAAKKNDLPKAGDLFACNFGKHLFQPLFHVRQGGKITILPVALNESEYQIVTDLKTWYDDYKVTLKKDGMDKQNNER